MAEEKMCPAEAMEKAVCEHDGVSWEKFKELLPEMSAKKIERQCVALRALAGEFQDPVIKQAIMWAADQSEQGGRP